MSEEDRKTEELEEEIGENEDEDEGSRAQGEALYNALKERGLIEGSWTWEEVAVDEQQKYQLVASDCGM